MMTDVDTVTTDFKEGGERKVATAVGEPRAERHANISTRKRSARIQLVLPEKSVERLEKLKKETESASYSEVLRDALRLYEALVDEEKNGNDLMIRKQSGDVEKLIIL